MKNIVVIGQIALAYFETQVELENFMALDGAFTSRALYSGPIGLLSEERAKRIAPLHPSFLTYYRDCLAVLWRGGGVCKEGTESAHLALRSLFPSVKYPFIVVWKPLEFQSLD